MKYEEHHPGLTDSAFQQLRKREETLIPDEILFKSELEEISGFSVTSEEKYLKLNLKWFLDFNI